MVQQGAEFIIANRGRPIVNIISIQTRALSLGERARRLEAQGLIDPIAGKDLSKIPVPNGIAQKMLQEVR